ncbi:MAG: hypothetical protein ACOCWO_01710 [Candidatus Muiribacteriaceae bacterium]
MNNRCFFFFPCNTLSVSLTGRSCEFSCPYCNGHFLRNMKTPGCEVPQGITSLLISGGVDSRGVIPFDKFQDMLAGYREKGIRINLHTGLVNSQSNIPHENYADHISFDFTLDDDVITLTSGGRYTSDHYIESLDLLKGSGIPITPHIMVGINRGEVVKEYEALKMLAAKGFDKIALLVFMPSDGTEWKNISAPDVGDVGKVFAFSVNNFAEVTLGCMRPGGSYRDRLDMEAYHCGIRRFVMPSRKLREFVSSNNIKVVEEYECCVF